MKNKTYIALILAFAMTTAGCSNQNNSPATTGTNTPNNTENNTGSENSTSEKAATIDSSKIFSDRDYETTYDENSSITIQLKGNSAACSSKAVQISDGTVTITEEGTYILSGTLDDGMIIVNADKSDKIQLFLNNVTIHSKSCAPIYVLQSDKVFITMADGSTNTLSNGGSFTAIDENKIDAVIFSKEDVTLNGAGTLVVTSPAGHGIVSKDSLKITSGSYDINCSSHAISSKDDVCITNSDFTITSGKDGIHAENADDASKGYVYIQSGTLHISAEGDGISASSCLQIEDGSFVIKAGGGSVNAAAHNSDSWGGFQGGGRHGGGPKDGNMPGGKGGQSDGNMPEGRGGKMDKGNRRNGTMPENKDSSDTADSSKDNITTLGSTNDSSNTTDSSKDNMIALSSTNNSSGSSDTTDDSNDSTSMKGIKASADLLINGGEFIMDSADDSFHSNGSATVNGGTFQIASGDDAFHADDTLTVTAGTINISESYEGLEGMHINISGGDITLTASDDGVNAAGGTDSSGNTGGRDGMFGHGGSSSNGSITISGATLNITASGDGIDANGSLDITGGNITVCGPTQGDTATLDYDTTGTVSGGTFIGTGASGRMSQTFSDSKQGVITANVGNQSAGTKIQLSDSKGNTLITHTPDLDFALVILSSPDIISGETYTLTIGTSSSEFTAS
ncbi:MAG: carbohydrate-binding domain-containing protein [Lachnospiraceae bacterium]|nr:carbohydrate-binding domain-containing protein [Lachnospiraceae bacterium]